MKFYFLTKLAYGNINDVQILDNNYIRTLPLIRWLEETVGKMKSRKDAGELFSGEGWSIDVDYFPDHSGQILQVKPYVCFTKKIPDEKITEFIMLWS